MLKHFDSRHTPNLPVLGLILLLLVTAAHAQTRNESEIFDASPSLLAREVHLDGDVLALTKLSVTGDDGLLIFEPGSFGDWQQTASLLPSDYLTGDQFGEGVVVDGSRVAASAYNHDVGGFNETGAIWIWERDPAGAWIEVTKVTTTPLAVARRLGNNGIDLDGDVLVGIGNTGPNQDGVFIFERDSGGNWVQTYSTSSSLIQYIGLSNDTVVAGRPGADGGNGEVQVHQKVNGSWTLRQTFGGPNRSADWGRYAVIDGDLLAFGGEQFSRPVVHVYQRDTNGLYQPLVVLATDELSDLALSGDRLAIGQRLANGVVVHGRNVGGADAWGVEVTLQTSDPTNGIGTDIALDGSLALAELDDSTVGLFDLDGSTVAIDATAPICGPGGAVDVTAVVDSTEAIDLMTYSIGGGAPQTVCTACGVDPSLSFSASPLAECSNTVQVAATDIFGVTAFDTVDVIYDDVAPSFQPEDCADRTILLPAGDDDTLIFPPFIQDNCEGGRSATCDNVLFGLGTTFVTCSYTDTCGQTASCSFTVTVEQEDPPPPPPTSACVEDDFEDAAVDSDWTLAGLGSADQQSVAEGGGTLDFTSDGSTAFAGSDNAGFFYRQWDGDFRAEVTIDGTTMQFGGGRFRKAGLMVRSSLDDGAPRVLANLIPYWDNRDETHLQWVARQTQDGPGNIALAPDAIGVPRVVRLAIERSGNTFSVQYSNDGGLTWITPSGGNGGSITVAMPETVLVGLDVVSNDVNLTSTARFDDFSICRTCFVVDDHDDGVLDPAWTLAGIGNANQQSAAEGGGTLQLTADGATAFYGADNAGFLYQEIDGDFRFESTVDGNPMISGGQYRKAGLMVRTGLDPWDVRLLANLVPFWQNQDETHLQFVAREAYGQPGRLPVARDVIGVPRVVRLAIERVGDTLSVEYSTDGGATWIQPTTGLGGSITIPGLPSTLLVGLDMVSNNISVTSTAHFDDTEICAP